MWVRMSTLQGDANQSDDEVERQVKLLRENILPVREVRFSDGAVQTALFMFK